MQAYQRGLDTGCPMLKFIFSHQKGAKGSKKGGKISNQWSVIGGWVCFGGRRVEDGEISNSIFQISKGKEKMDAESANQRSEGRTMKSS